MEFHDFATTHDVARRLGLTDEPAARFYHQMQGVVIQGHRQGIPGTASEFNRYHSELTWYDAGRPYYKLWPAVIPLLAGVGTEVRPGAQCDCRRSEPVALERCHD